MRQDKERKWVEDQTCVIDTELAEDPLTRVLGTDPLIFEPYDDFLEPLFLIVINYT